MIVFKKSIQLTSHIIRLKAAGKKIGFVPTMGALHQGHLSLLEQSIQVNEITVCSIFVNPTQFNDARDFRKYPVTIEKDIYMLEKAGTDLMFLPGVEEMYPGGTGDLQHFDIGNLEHLLEGAFRPNHFQGVCQVMSRLLNIVQPHNLYMGQKDYQQCMVVQRLLKILNSDVIFNRCPTLREKSGLAMSSRNLRLSDEEKEKAVTISAVLQYFKENLQPGNLVPMMAKGKEMLEAKQFKTDYVEITDNETLEPITNWNGNQQLVALIAAFINDIRLIDNMTLKD
jgi:pantoate--beta-alanine ligase